MRAFRALCCLAAIVASHSIASFAAPVPLTGAVRIDAGHEFACALLANGGVHCWGRNSFGQLGDGFPAGFRGTAQFVSGLSNGVASIGLGAGHACAILAAGSIKCWGWNSSGQLGNGASGANQPLPVDVAGLGGIATALALGDGHTCALMSDKTVKCWGDATPIGHGAASPQVTPLAIPGLTNVAAITAGPAHNCVLLESGAAKCWGRNGAGQLGDGGTMDSTVPVEVTGLSSGVAALSAGGSFYEGSAGTPRRDASFTCALMIAGGLKCWGSNLSGQLGDGTLVAHPVPSDVSGLTSGVSQVSTGGMIHGFVGLLAPMAHACAVTSAGSVKCWGSNRCSQVTPGADCFVANLALQPVTTPIAVPGSGVAAIAAGGAFTCSLRSADGAVGCHGVLADFYPRPQPLSFDVMVGPEPQVIRFGMSPVISVGSSGTVTVTWGSSGSPVTLTNLTPGICTVPATPTASPPSVTIGGLAQGKCRFAANQAGTAYYDAAPEVIAEVRVGDKLPQTVAFGPAPTAVPVQGYANLQATATSGLPITFGSSTPTRCSVANVAGIVEGLTVGQCTATASQPGDDFFLPAVQATQSFPVVAMDTTAIRMSNISTRVHVSSGEEAAPIAGFVIAPSIGATKKVAIVATGPSLASSGIANPLADSVVAVVRSSDNRVVGTNDNWMQHPSSAQLTAAGLAPSDPSEAALVLDLLPGAYTARVTGKSGGTGVSVIAVYEIDRLVNRLINISTRGEVRTGDEVMIAGFVISGSGPQQVAIVVTGPSLAQYGITAPLANPTLSLVRSSDQAVLATNDDWQTAPNAAQLQAAGFAPPNAAEAAILTTLPPGAYTAIVSGVGGTTGIAVVGVYAVP